jgi:hypothetical protein
MTTRLSGILAAGALAVLAGGRTAHAELDGLATAFVTGGATSNPLLAPDTLAPATWDEFTTVRASVRGRYLGPRTEQLLSYTYAGTFYASTTAANAQVHDLAWLLTATPTARTDLRAGAGATYGTLNSVNPLAATAAFNVQNVAAPPPAVPTGAVTYVGANASANGFYRPRGVTTWGEVTTVTSFVPVSGDAGRSLAAVQTGHYEHLWGRNALTSDLMGSYFKSTTFTLANGTTFAGTETLQLQGMAGWRHELSPALYLAASAGVLLIDAVGAGHLAVEPVAFATAHYQTPHALAELTLTQSTELNVYLGQPLLIDGAVARVALPLDRLERFKLIGVGTAQREWTITPSVDAAVDLLAADVGLAFTPLQQPFYASLDYTTQQQIGHVAAGMGYPSLHRQLVMLTLTATWGTAPALR